MAARSSPSVLDRRRAYLDAAQRLFAEHGFERTTMDMLVAAVGGSKATLYKHFPSKDSLVAGLMQDVADVVNRPAPMIVADDAPLVAALTAFGESALRGVVSRQAIAILRLCLGEYSRFPELSAVVWEHGPAVTYANFRDFLEQRRADGELLVDDAQLAAEQFIAGIVGHLQLKVAMGIAEPPDEAEIARRVASAVEAFLAAHAT